MKHCETSPAAHVAWDLSWNQKRKAIVWNKTSLEVYTSHFSRLYVNVLAPFTRYNLLTTCWTNSGCSFNTFVKPVVKSVWQPFVSCKRGISKQRRSTKYRKTSEAINFCIFLYNFTMTSIFLIFGLHNFSSWTAQIELWTAQNWLDCTLRIRLGGAERSCWEVDVVDDIPHFGYSQQRHRLRTKYAVRLKPCSPKSFLTN